jgi:hypothetical protein
MNWIMYYEYSIIQRANTEWKERMSEDDKESNNFLDGNMLHQIILFFGCLSVGKESHCVSFSANA